MYLEKEKGKRVTKAIERKKNEREGEREEEGGRQSA
jgi:hypothetical protein